MFINAQAYTDPNDVACGKENPKIVMTGLTHKNYYSSSFYKAPFDFVIKPSETITVHFNAPPAVRWLNGDGGLEQFTDKDFTLAVVNQSKEDFKVLKNTLLEQVIEHTDIKGDEFRLTSRVYRHQAWKNNRQGLCPPPPPQFFTFTLFPTLR
jgi:hypothetical protein